MKKRSMPLGLLAAIPPLLWSGAVHAEFNGTVEDLSEGYMLYQAIDACQLHPSEHALAVLQAAIKTFEAAASEDQRRALWKKAAEDMPRVTLLGLCEVINAEIQLLELVNSPSMSGGVPPKPEF